MKVSVNSSLRKLLVSRHLKNEREFVEAKCSYTVRNENIYVKDTFDRVDFLEDFHRKPRLKRSHKYYTQTQEQLLVCGVCHGFFIGWTQGGLSFYE